MTRSPICPSCGQTQTALVIFTQDGTRLYRVICTPCDEQEIVREADEADAAFAESEAA